MALTFCGTQFYNNFQIHEEKTKFNEITHSVLASKFIVDDKTSCVAEASNA